MQVIDIFIGRKIFKFVSETMIGSAVQTILSTKESNNRAIVMISFGLDLSHCL